MIIKDLQLPLIEFIKHLVSGGEGVENWQEVYMMYLESLGSQDIDIIVTRSAEIEHLNNKIKLGAMLLNMIEHTNNYALIEILPSFDYPIGLVLTPENSFEYCEMFEGYLKGEQFRIAEILDSIKQDGGEETNKVDLNYFERMIVSFEIAFKKDIDINTISTSKYCQYYRAYYEFVKTKQKTDVHT